MADRGIWAMQLLAWLIHWSYFHVQPCLGFILSSAIHNRPSYHQNLHVRAVRDATDSSKKEDEDRVLIVASRLPVVAYREGDVGERMMSRFYTKLKQQAGDDGKGSSSSPFDSAKSARSGSGGAGVGVMAGADPTRTKGIFNALQLSSADTGAGSTISSQQPGKETLSQIPPPSSPKEQQHDAKDEEKPPVPQRSPEELKMKAAKMIWIGWAGLNDPAPTEEVALRAELESRDCIPVMLREKSCAAYFDGMCNDVLWPLMHGAEPGLGDRSLHGHERQWRAYVEANKAYAAEVIEAYQPGDVVFLHDYHLMLVPQLLRAAVGPSMRIGWFCHVPFPPEPLWRRIPARRQLLEGLLAADLLAFHTEEYGENFAAACARLLGYKPVNLRGGRNAAEQEGSESSRSGAGERRWFGSGSKRDSESKKRSGGGGRGITSETTWRRQSRSRDRYRYTIGPHGTSVAAYPIGIDPERFISAPDIPGVSEAINAMGSWLGVGAQPPPSSPVSLISREENGPPTVTDTKPPTLYQPSASSSVEQRKIILGVDRLDYVKGIPEKLEAFERYLDRYPEEVGRTIFVQVAVPTRTSIPRYKELASRVRNIVARINGRFILANYGQILLDSVNNGKKEDDGRQQQAVPPVVYIEQNMPFAELAALYTLADVLLITSFSDGMNLVASEYVASQTTKATMEASTRKGVKRKEEESSYWKGSSDSKASLKEMSGDESGDGRWREVDALRGTSIVDKQGYRNPGVLVLSEFAGVADVITSEGALLINPYDTSAVAETLRIALHTMGSEERYTLHMAALERILDTTASGWAGALLKELRFGESSQSEASDTNSGSSFSSSSSATASTSIFSSSFANSNSAEASSTSFAPWSPVSYSSRSGSSVYAAESSKEPEQPTSSSNGGSGAANIWKATVGSVPKVLGRGQRGSSAPALPSALLRLESFLPPRKQPVLFVDISTLLLHSSTSSEGANTQQQQQQQQQDTKYEGNLESEEIDGEVNYKDALKLDDATRVALQKIADAITLTIVSSCSAKKAREIVSGSGSELGDTSEVDTGFGSSNNEEISVKRKAPSASVSTSSSPASLANVWFAASSGFEIEGARDTAVEYRVGDVYRPVLEDARAALRDMLAGIPGAVVHDQDESFLVDGFSVVVSYGDVAPYERGGVEAAVAEVLGLAPNLKRVTPSADPTSSLSTSTGPSSRGRGKRKSSGETSLNTKDLIQIRPRVEWNTGRAVAWLLQRFQSLQQNDPGSLFPIYIGGDQPEQEAVFSLVRNMGGVGVLVSERKPESFTPNDSSAAYHLKPDELAQFLLVFEQSYQSSRTMPLWASSTEASASPEKI